MSISMVAHEIANMEKKKWKISFSSTYFSEMICSYTHTHRRQYPATSIYIPIIRAIKFHEWRQRREEKKTRQINNKQTVNRVL